jgi:biopolymer transport protein TolR
MPRRRRRRPFELNADVNVVSLIDVMLLLLVIFMITAPMMQGGVDINLPQAQARPLESKSGLTITVNRAGEIRIDEQKPLTLNEFRVAFKLYANRTKGGVYLRADRDVPYGTVAQLMAIMRAANVNEIGLVTEQELIP